MDHRERRRSDGDDAAAGARRGAVARRLDDPQACIVVVLADTGERYLSKVYNDEWLRENQLIEAERRTVADVVSHKDHAAPPLASVGPQATVRQALNLMSTYNVSQLPVL